MTKYDTLIQFIRDMGAEDQDYDIRPTNYVLTEFEIAWESGQFNEEPKGECAL